MVPSRLGTQHHPAEVAGLIELARSKRPREQHRTSIVDLDGGVRRAEIIVPIESLDADTTLRSLHKLLPARAFRAHELAAAPSSVSVVLDDFSFVAYIGTNADAHEVSGTHDGAEFARLAASGTVDFYVTSGVDVRRAGPDDVATAADDGNVFGARVASFVVTAL